MKNLLTALLLFGTAFPVLAQEFDVRSFAADPQDLRARMADRRTVNDERCAVVVVTTNIPNMQFNSDIGIVDVEHTDDGYELFVAPRERRIKLMATGFLSLDVQMPEPAKALTVYKMTVASKGQKAQSADVVRVTFRISEEAVYVRHGSGAP